MFYRQHRSNSKPYSSKRITCSNSFSALNSDIINSVEKWKRDETTQRPKTDKEEANKHNFKVLTYPLYYQMQTDDYCKT